MSRAIKARRAWTDVAWRRSWPTRLDCSRSCDVRCFRVLIDLAISVGFGFPSQAAVSGDWVSRTLWIAWCNRHCSRYWSRCLNRRFTTAVTVFDPRRGARTAIAEAKKHLAGGYAWTVDIDLSKFFDRVNHQRLLNRLSQQVKDGRILKLVHRMLKAQVVLPDGTRTATEEGTPQGGPLSPLLSNIVLDELDWELERRGLRFVRYADDFSVFVQSERCRASGDGYSSSVYRRTTSSAGERR